MTKDSNYVLSVGEKFEERLVRLNSFSNPYTFPFLQRSGLKKGDTVIDVGCGIGELSCWLAEQVGSNGKVIAIDISKEQLSLAKKRAALKNLTNIEFFEISIYDLNKLHFKFDLVYSRYVIDHVVEQQHALRIMTEITRDGGVICCESAAMNIRNAFTYPNLNAIDKIHGWFDSLKRLNVYSSDLGLRLPGMMRQLNLKNINIDLIRPKLKTSYQKEHELLILEECQEAYISQGIATKNEIQEAKKSIARAIANENIEFFGLKWRKFQQLNKSIEKQTGIKFKLMCIIPNSAVAIDFFTTIVTT